MLGLEVVVPLLSVGRYDVGEILDQINYHEMSPEAQFVMGPRTWLPSEPLRLNLRGHRGKRLYRVRVEVWAHNLLNHRPGDTTRKGQHAVDRNGIVASQNGWPYIDSGPTIN